jgi:hypothetical protein
VPLPRIHHLLVIVIFSRSIQRVHVPSLMLYWSTPLLAPAQRIPIDCLGDIKEPQNANGASAKGPGQILILGVARAAECLGLHWMPVHLRSCAFNKKHCFEGGID